MSDIDNFTNAIDNEKRRQIVEHLLKNTMAGIEEIKKMLSIARPAVMDHIKIQDAKIIYEEKKKRNQTEEK